ncbi:pyridoxal-dependent decarboxylase [Candidatus Peregrinibacteria bacterium CG_4_10_14_0_2_um_filter_38_24]|nr:MAG: pyridoxal-dependent decarboxylase [Candidatus Peregrinibacteria bacterium CG_4_10_14_0_2_um_filter_38_24]
MPETGVPVEELIDDFNRRILPLCTNFGSPQFMGFPDAGNSVAALAGSVAMNFANQNLINQSFCSPVGTLTEIAVIQWLRETVGYDVKGKVNDVWDVGGIIMPGGTGSNTVGMMLAREKKLPGTMQNGVSDLDKCHIVIPKGIGHYSVKSAQMWLGCGNRLIEVETDNYRYDLGALEKVMKERHKDIMGVVAYGGDSRTMTVDNFKAIHEIVRTEDDNIWLHADACHGFSLGFSPRLRHKIEGMELFDSISTDPHKVMATPYVVSALLVKDPAVMKTITSLSDLIMQGKFDFGQITPFLGSRSWNSLKLWLMMRNAGKDGLAELIDHRHDRACYLAERVKGDKDFLLINDVEINSVAFMYMGDMDRTDIEKINKVNKELHELLLREGIFHLHQFSIPDAGKLAKGEIIYPHRFMTGNLRLTTDKIDEMLEYVRQKGKQIENGTI